MECHALGCCGLQGGGLYIWGTATLTNTNVYSNEASVVRWPSALAWTIPPYRPLELTLALTGCCARARVFDSSF